MRYTSSLNPGDILKVDTETGEMTVNGREVYTYSGSLSILYPNTTTLTYTDSEASRNLSLQLEYQERYE